MIIQQKKKQEDKPGYVIRVTGYIEKDGEIGCKGINLLNGKEQTFWLTTEGVLSENKRRKSIQQMRDGYVIGRDFYKLIVGGRIHFKGCFRRQDFGDENYFSTWPNPIGYDKEAVSNNTGFSFGAFLQFVVPNSETTKPYGYMTIYPKDKILETNDLEEIRAKIENQREKNKFCTFMVRYINYDRELLGFHIIGANARFCKKASSDYPAQDYADNCIATIEEKGREYPDSTAYSIVFCTTYSITKEGTKSKADSRVNYWNWVASNFYDEVEMDGETVRDYYARELFYKLSDYRMNKGFVSDVYLTNTKATAAKIDPSLIGGLKVRGQGGQKPVQPQRVEKKEEPKTEIREQTVNDVSQQPKRETQQPNTQNAEQSQHEPHRSHGPQSRGQEQSGPTTQQQMPPMPPMPENPDDYGYSNLGETLQSNSY